MRHVAAALGVTREVELPEAARARAAAYVITAAEGAALHLARLRTRAADFDPDVRDRLIAGAMVPAAMVTQAQNSAAGFASGDARCSMRSMRSSRRRPRVRRPDRPEDILARRRGTSGARRIWACSHSRFPSSGCRWWRCRWRRPLPIGVQIIAPPWREDIALRIARVLEAAGVVAAPRPALEEAPEPGLSHTAKSGVSPVRLVPRALFRRWSWPGLSRRPRLIRHGRALLSGSPGQARR